MTLYERLMAVGATIENHYSDLYTPVDDKSAPIMREFKDQHHITTFISNVDGKRWYEAPFAFDPYWEARLSE